MTKRQLVFIALVALLVGTASTQIQTQGQMDVRALLQAVAKNQGTDALRTIQYTASGMIAAPGQSYTPMDEQVGVPEHWPRFALTDYTMTIDFETMAFKEEYTRTPPAMPKQAYAGLDEWSGGGTGNQSDPALIRGGGGIANPTPIRFTHFVNRNYAWQIQQGNPQRQFTYLAGVDMADYRRLMIAMDPHGFIKAALLPDANPRFVGGEALHLPGGKPAPTQRLMITMLGKYTVLATINQNLVTDTETWIPNPILGDMRVNNSYRRWKDFAGVKFYTDNHPHFIARGQEDNAQYRIHEVRANVAIPQGTLAVPPAVQQATAPPVRVETQKLADQVYLLGGGSHNSLLVEFRDFVAVVEAPLNDERSQAVIAEVKRLVPNKPIRYVINTHHHWDHSGGLRGYVAEGATIITHQENIPYYRQLMFGTNTWRVMPDRLARRNEAEMIPRNPQFLGVGNRYVLNDYEWGTGRTSRAIELHSAVQGSPPWSNHAEWNVAVYLPAERILINADLYSPPAPGAPLPAEPPEGVVALGMLVRSARLNVAQHVPIHGRPGTHEEFVKILRDREVPDSHGPLILPSTTTSR
jgi:Metallo-beta-lactamase superfamily